MNLQELVSATNHGGIVTGLTHSLYRYPARFSPMFARAAIETFTKPGDIVLDPFVGGSTTLVESLALGRHSIGVDVSELSLFLARVKTSLHADRELQAVSRWAKSAISDLSPLKPVERHWVWREAGYQENLPWRFRKVAEQALNATTDLPKALQPLARCIILRTLQWAVDCKKYLPTAADFRDHLIENTEEAVAGLRDLASRVERTGRQPATVEVFHESAENISNLQSKLLRRRRARLVVTSPPYPGVHVLYHRWQVLGRRETRAPFWIADCRDGQGTAFYTFADRQNTRHEDLYFAKLLSAFTGIRKAVSSKAFIVQLVGFSEPDRQLPMYLDTMQRAGFGEYRGNLPQIWRDVPHRKWYTSLREKTRRTSEALLIHRPV